jgi:hypothetical protein
MMAKQSGDKKFKANSNKTMWLVNGMSEPEISMRPGEWQRWRLVTPYIAKIGGPVEIELPEQCEMQLLAKDGVYIRDYPRRISMTKVPTGGRCDLMVRCHTKGSFRIMQEDTGKMYPLFTLKVDGPREASKELEKWAPVFPTYLSDLMNLTTGDVDSMCRTEFGSPTDPKCET